MSFKNEKEKRIQTNKIKTLRTILTIVFSFWYLKGFQCKVTDYKCGNGQCISKHKRCNGIHGDCLDDSDEDGCICRTGYFTCTNHQCIHHTQLCDRKRDCPDGEDEHHCGKKLAITMKTEVESQNREHWIGCLFYG